MGSRYKIEQAVEAAQRADAIIYSVYYVDNSAYGGYFGGGGDGDLKRMSEDTGGRLFKVDRKNTLQDIFARINDELRTQYSIGYTPSNAVKDNTFRRVEVKPVNKDYKAQARKGYYAAPSEAR
jgi:VWFA-related protein